MHSVIVYRIKENKKINGTPLDRGVICRTDRLKSTKNGCKEKQQEPFKISGAESNPVPFYILTYEDDWNIVIIDTE